MTFKVNHALVISGIPHNPPPGGVGVDDWNADLNVTGILPVANGGLGGATTNDLDEGGLHLYFTDDRAQAAMSGLYEVPLTFSTGLTRTLNTVTVNASQNITKLTNLATDGFVKTINADGTLSIDTSVYLTSNQAITLSGDLTGSGSTSIAATLATVNSNVGSFGTSTQVPTITVNAKGLVTAISNTSIQIAQSQVTDLTTDLSGKQPLDATLTAIAGVTTASDKIIYFNGVDTATSATFTAAGRALIDDADNTAQRATLGLGTIATQDANNVSLTGGNIDGVTLTNIPSMTITNGGYLMGGTTATNSYTLSAWSTTGVRKDFITLVTGTTPSMFISAPTGGTGSIDNLTIGGSVPRTGAFTQVIATGTASADLKLHLLQNLGSTSGKRNMTLNYYGLDDRLVLQSLADNLSFIRNIVSFYHDGQSVFESKVSVGAGTLPTYQLDVFNGDIAAMTLGRGFRVKEGTNARMGAVVLTAGAATVSNTAVTANSRIFLTCNVAGGTRGFLSVFSRVAGTSFTINSSSAADTSTVGWVIFEPA